MLKGKEQIHINKPAKNLRRFPIWTKRKLSFCPDGFEGPERRLR